MCNVMQPNYRKKTDNYLQININTSWTQERKRKRIQLNDMESRGGSILILPVSIRYRYFWPKISAISISISFTAVLFGLLIYFIIASKKKMNDVNVIP